MNRQFNFSLSMEKFDLIVIQENTLYNKNVYYRITSTNIF